jgi:hypothetical protein
MTSTITDLDRLIKDAESVVGFVAQFDPSGDAEVAAVWLPIADDVASLVARLAANGSSQKQSLMAVGAAVQRIGADIQAAAGKL